MLTNDTKSKLQRSLHGFRIDGIFTGISYLCKGACKP